MNQTDTKTHTILIVDDKSENIDALIASLKQVGFDLLVAQSGEEALDLLRRIHPDLILTETTNKLKGFELGAVDYITKPFQQQKCWLALKLI
jgi:CheY-like chemotaxis protein